MPLPSAWRAIERAWGFLEAAQLSEGWVRQMSERALLLEAHHTTHIEGTHLTLAEAEQLLAGQPVPQADADDVRELLNYRDAFNLVSDYLDSGAPITEGLVREIHKRLVRGVRGDRAQPGQYRLVQNYVANSITGAIIYTPPPPGDVPALMRDLVEWLNNPAKCIPCWLAALRSSISCTFIPSWMATARRLGCSLRYVSIAPATISSDCSPSASTMTAIDQPFTWLSSPCVSRTWT